MKWRSATVGLAIMLCLGASLPGCGAPNVDTAVEPVPTVAATTAVGPREPALRSLAKGGFIAQGTKAPAVYQARSALGVPEFAAILSQEQRNAIVEASTGDDLTLSVFGGPSGGSGATISVREVSVKDTQLRVVISHQLPAPTEYSLPAVTIPYHVVEVPRSGFGGALPSS